MSGRVAGFAGLRGLKVIALGALVAGTLLTGAGPAAAHDDDGPSWRHHEHGWGEREQRREELSRQQEWRERQAWQERQARREHREHARDAWRRDQWRERHGWVASGVVYGAPPAVVYAPPPSVVYAPPARGGFEFSVNVPIR